MSEGRTADLTRGSRQLHDQLNVHEQHLTALIDTHDLSDNSPIAHDLVLLRARRQALDICQAFLSDRPTKPRTSPRTCTSRPQTADDSGGSTAGSDLAKVGIVPAEALTRFLQLLVDDFTRLYPTVPDPLRT